MIPCMLKLKRSILRQDIIKLLKSNARRINYKKRTTIYFIKGSFMINREFLSKNLTRLQSKEKTENGLCQWRVGNQPLSFRDKVEVGCGTLTGLGGFKTGQEFKVILQMNSTLGYLRPSQIKTSNNNHNNEINKDFLKSNKPQSGEALHY